MEDGPAQSDLRSVIIVCLNKSGFSFPAPAYLVGLAMLPSLFWHKTTPGFRRTFSCPGFNSELLSEMEPNGNSKGDQDESNLRLLQFPIHQWWIWKLSYSAAKDILLPIHLPFFQRTALSFHLVKAENNPTDALVNHVSVAYVCERLYMCNYLFACLLHIKNI